jgi:hypothetical protein
MGRSGSTLQPFARRYQARRRPGILVSNQTGPREAPRNGDSTRPVCDFGATRPAPRNRRHTVSRA